MPAARSASHVHRARRGLVALLAVLAMVATACGAEDDAGDAAGSDVDEPDAADEVEPDVDNGQADDVLSVVATTSILGDIVENLVGDDGEVTVIIPPGVDPHGFQPSPSDAAALRNADLVVANGLDLEESLVSVLDAAVEDGVRVVELAAQLDPIEFEWDGLHGHADDDDHADEDGRGELDPHVWFDPVRMAEGVHVLAAELAAADDRLDAAEWEQRGQAYADEVLAVHEEMEQLFAAIPPENRHLVTNHDALGYLAARYDFEVVGTVIPGASTQADADPRQFAELIEAVEHAGVTAVFAENTDSTRLADQLASEVIGRGDLEVEVVPVYTDALGEPGSGADTYLGLLRTDAQLIADALG